MNKKIIFALALVIIALAIFGYLRFTNEPEYENTRLYGNIDIREAQFAFRVSGRLEIVGFEEGDKITKGDLIASLDDQPMRENLAVIAAQLEEAKAKLSLLEAGTRVQIIDQAKAKVSEVKAAYENISKDLARQKELLNIGAGSQKILDAAKSLQQQTKARLVTAQRGLKLAQEGARAEEITAAQAAVSTVTAKMQQIETQVNDAKLVASSNGVISTRIHEPGEMVSAGQAIYSVSLLDSIYVRAYVNETLLGSVVPGTSVKIKTDSSNKVYSGQVGFISPNAEFTPKSVETADLRTDLVYRLRILVSDPDSGLRQGMPVTIEF